MAGWKKEIIDSVQSHLDSKHIYSESGFRKMVSDVLVEAKSKPAATLLGGLVASLDGGTKARIAPLLRGKPIVEVIDVLSRELPEQLPEAFRFSAQGFKILPTKKEFIAELVQRFKASEDATALIQAYLIAFPGGQAGHAVSSQRVVEMISSLRENSLRLQLDADYIRPYATALAGEGALDIKRDIIEPVQRGAGRYVEQTVAETKSASGDIKLREMEPGRLLLSIFLSLPERPERACLLRLRL